MNVSIEPSDFLTNEFEAALSRSLEKVLAKILSQLGQTEPRPLLLGARKTSKTLGGICEKTLWNHTYPRGTIPSLKIGTRTFYDPRDLEKWIDEQKQEGSDA